MNRIVKRFRRSSKPKETVKPVETTDEEENDHQWDRPIEFLLSLISNSVGLGNVWRFPYLAAQSGGGAFLIPYFVLYFLVGAPMYFMELALGQFTSRGPATCFTMARGWRGVGYAMILNSTLGSLYYNVIIAWALFYFILSFRRRLLWSDCNNWWNTDRCFVPGSESIVTASNETILNCTNVQLDGNLTSECSIANSTIRVTAAEEFYYRLLLNKSPSIDEFGTPGLYMSLLLLVSWAIICVCIIRGVQSSGKVAYFTSIFPYIVLTVLIIFTATLPGAGDGIRFYIVPRWELIGNFEIWQAAASQVFFSLSLSFGSLIAYAAANKFDNNFYKQMAIVVSCDCFTGVFAGFAVFATVGFLARSLGESVEKYATASGPSLAFITYPEALAKMPASPFFSIIFFMMLLALGIGSQFASTDVLVTALMEFFPRYAKRRSVLVVLACVGFFLCSLPFACPGGIYLFNIFQEYTANISLVLMGFFEITAISYIYGFNRFMNDIKMMLNKRPAEYYLFITWTITAPLLTLVLTITNFLNTAPLRDGAAGGFDAYEYPRWTEILGWLIFVCCNISIPLVFILTYIQQYRSILSYRKMRKTVNNHDFEYPSYLEAIRTTIMPSKSWGPRRKKNQVGVYAHLNADLKNSQSLSTISIEDSTIVRF